MCPYDAAACLFFFFSNHTLVKKKLQNRTVHRINMKTYMGVYVFGSGTFGDNPTGVTTSHDQFVARQGPSELNKR